MLNYGFATLEKIALCQTDEYEYLIPVLNGDKDTVRVRNTDALSVTVNAGENEVESHVRLGRYAIAPINAGDVLGEVIFTVNGAECGRAPLVAEYDVKTNKKEGIFGKIASLFR